PRRRGGPGGGLPAGVPADLRRLGLRRHLVHAGVAAGVRRAPAGQRHGRRRPGPGPRPAGRRGRHRLGRLVARHPGGLRPAGRPPLPADGLTAGETGRRPPGPPPPGGPARCPGPEPPPCRRPGPEGGAARRPAPPSLRARRPGKLARPRRRSPMPSSTPTRALPVSPHPTAATIDELVAGATSRRPFRTADAKSGSRFERVEIGGERFVLKVVHVDDDWIARSLGDLTCRQVTVWSSGLLDALPPTVDHAVVGAARGFGRNGWGAALLMRDVGEHLVPEGDDPVPAEQHAAFVEHLADVSARFWGWRDD